MVRGWAAARSHDMALKALVATMLVVRMVCWPTGFDTLPVLSMPMAVAKALLAARNERYQEIWLLPYTSTAGAGLRMTLWIMPTRLPAAFLLLGAAASSLSLRATTDCMSSLPQGCVSAARSRAAACDRMRSTQHGVNVQDCWLCVHAAETMLHATELHAHSDCTPHLALRLPGAACDPLVERCQQSGAQFEDDILDG